ncbi:MAG: restriction endonuclease [Xanthomonadaceae bacterium]|nr:restriction endonuclease [Xanthomonadaceae bacterium]
MTTSNPTEARSPDAPVRIGRAEFERLLAEHYREQGWQVERCANAQGIDRGIDFKLRRQQEYVLVHCKHWNALEAPQHDVNGLIAAMAAESATGAILICGGEFSPEARIAAQRQARLRLIDGAALREMLGSLPELPRNRATFKASAPPQPASHSAPGRVTASSAAASSRAARSSSPMQIGGGLVFLGLLIAAAIFVYGVMNQAPSPPPIVVAPPTPAPATTAVADSAAEATPPPKPTIEVPGVDDAPPNDPAQTPTSAEAEAREAQRRAEEAMKVIESNTPEI